MTGTSTEQVATVHANLSRYADREAFKAHYAAYMVRGGMLLQTKPRPKGTRVRFDITVGDGETVMRGEGVVQGTKRNSAGKPVGVILKFTKLDRASKALAREMMELKALRVSGNFSAVGGNSSLGDASTSGEAEGASSPGTGGDADDADDAADSTDDTSDDALERDDEENTESGTGEADPDASDAGDADEEEDAEDQKDEPKSGSSLHLPRPGRVPRPRRASRFEFGKRSSLSKPRFGSAAEEEEASKPADAPEAEATAPADEPAVVEAETAAVTPAPVETQAPAKPAPTKPALPEGAGLVGDDIGAIADAIEDSFDAIFGGGDLFGESDSSHDEPGFPALSGEAKSVEDPTEPDDDVMKTSNGLPRFSPDEVAKLRRGMAEADQSPAADAIAFDDDDDDDAIAFAEADEDDAIAFADDEDDAIAFADDDDDDAIAFADDDDDAIAFADDDDDDDAIMFAETDEDDDDAIAFAEADEDDAIVFAEEVEEDDAIVFAEEASEASEAADGDPPTRASAFSVSDGSGETEAEHDETARRIRSLIQSITGEHTAVPDEGAPVRSILQSMSGSTPVAQEASSVVDDVLDDVLGDIAPPPAAPEIIAPAVLQPIVEDEPSESSEDDSPKKKRGFFSRLFGRD